MVIHSAEMLSSSVLHMFSKSMQRWLNFPDSYRTHLSTTHITPITHLSYIYHTSIMPRIGYASLITPAPPSFFDTITQPLRFIYTLTLSLGDPSLWYTMQVLGDSKDPKEVRKLEAYRDVDTTGALT